MMPFYYKVSFTQVSLLLINNYVRIRILMAITAQAHFLQPTALQNALPAIVRTVAPTALGRQNPHVIAATEVPGAGAEKKIQNWLVASSHRNVLEKSRFVSSSHIGLKIKKSWKPRTRTRIGA
jgi:hypothetical protein